MNESSDSKFMNRNQNIVNDLSNLSYSAGNEIIYSTGVLKSNVCDYNGAFILVELTSLSKVIILQLKVTFTNCAPFIKCITKIDGTAVDR